VLFGVEEDVGVSLAVDRLEPVAVNEPRSGRDLSDELLEVARRRVTLDIDGDVQCVHGGSCLCVAVWVRGP
jgi:hypothetical protein